MFPARDIAFHLSSALLWHFGVPLFIWRTLFYSCVKCCGIVRYLVVSYGFHALAAFIFNILFCNIDKMYTIYMEEYAG